MTYQLIVRPKAEEQTTQAHTWFEEKVPGLGEDFLLCVEAALSAITRNPQLYQTRYKDVRIALTERFPFGIHYFIDGSRVIVILILHLSRSPKMWHK